MLIRLSVFIEHQGTRFSNDQVRDKDEILLGRDVGSTLQIPHNKISRKHCVIKREGLQYFISDLGSRHGTLLNGAMLKPNEPMPLRDGDVLRLADAEVHVTIFESDSGGDTQARLRAFLGTEHSLDPYIVVMSGRHKDQRFSLQGAKVDLMLGRSEDCDILIDDANASRRHGRIHKDVLKGLVFECLGARNQSIINGEKVERSGSHVLQDRDVLQFGSVRMMFVNPGADIERAVAEALGTQPPKVEEPKVEEPKVEDEPTSDPVDPVAPDDPVDQIDQVDISKLKATLDVVDRPPTEQIAIPQNRGRDLAITFAAGAVFGAGAVLLFMFIA